MLELIPCPPEAKAKPMSAGDAVPPPVSFKIIAKIFLGQDRKDSPNSDFIIASQEPSRHSAAFASVKITKMIEQDIAEDTGALICFTPNTFTGKCGPAPDC
jgi:hypothetical protein